MCGCDKHSATHVNHNKCAREITHPYANKVLNVLLAAMTWVYKLNTNKVVLGLNALEIKPVFKADQCENVACESASSDEMATGCRQVCQAM